MCVIKLKIHVLTYCAILSLKLRNPNPEFGCIAVNRVVSRYWISPHISKMVTIEV